MSALIEPIEGNVVPKDGGGEHQRVLICLGTYLPGYKAGGPIRSIENLVAALGDEFQFKIITRDRDLGDKAPYPGITVKQWVRVGLADVMCLRPGWLGLLGTFGLLRSLDQNTVLYLNSYFSRCFSILPMFMYWLGLCRPRQVVLAPRGEFSPGALALKKRRKLVYIRFSRWLGLHEHIIWHASSEFEAADIRQSYSGWPSIDVAAVIATAQGIVAPASSVGQRRCKKAGELRVIFVSRISRKKNLSSALKMLDGILGDVLFDIYGPAEDASYWSECQKLISALPANVRVEYQGQIEHEKTGRVFVEHDLFLFPTLGENFGHVICESLAAGCPVLISDQTPWRDLEKHGAGWAIPLQETERFRSVIQQCVDADGDWYAALSANAKQYGERIMSDPEVVNGNRRLFQDASVSLRQRAPHGFRHSYLW
jgi:glycosyltransferase involved in cell wall biosynthesis